MVALLLYILLCSQTIFCMELEQPIVRTLQKKPSKQELKKKQDQQRFNDALKKSIATLKHYFTEQNTVENIVNNFGQIDHAKMRYKIADSADTFFGQELVKNLIVPYIMDDVTCFMKRQLVIHNCRNKFTKESAKPLTMNIPFDYQWFAHHHDIHTPEHTIELCRPNHQCIITSFYNPEQIACITIHRYNQKNSCNEHITLLLGYYHVYKMFFNTTGSKFFLILSNGQIQIRHSFTGKIVRNGVRGWSNNSKNAKLKGIAFNSDWGLFATVTNKGNPVRLWESETGRHIASFFTGLPVNTVSFTPDMTYLIATDGTKIIKAIKLLHAYEEKSIGSITNRILTAKQALACFGMTQPKQEKKSAIQVNLTTIKEILSHFNFDERMVYAIAMGST